MEMKRMKPLLLLAAALLCQNLAFFSVSADSNVEGDKHYYSRDPHHAPSAPRVSVSPPHSSGGYGRPSPRHSYGTPPTNCGNPPRRSSGSPSGHRGGYYRSPPTSTPTPITNPTPTPTPITNPTPTPITNPTPTPVITPTPPFDPNSPPFSLTPPVTTTPTTPITPIINPTPPFTFSPTSPPFTFPFWRNHPTLVWGLVGWFGTLGNAFGLPSLPGFGSNANVMQALSNPRTDGYGELYREGTAALLNAMAPHTRFPYTTSQVRDSFVAALNSNQAAGAQAKIFQMANEGRIKG